MARITRRVTIKPDTGYTAERNNRDVLMEAAEEAGRIEGQMTSLNITLRRDRYGEVQPTVTFTITEDR